MPNIEENNMFTKRANGRGITFVGGHTLGRDFKNTIEDGDSVVLHIGKESVLVNNISLLPNNITGKVYGFEPSFSLEFNGIKIDDEINFNEEHVISCSSH